MRLLIIVSSALAAIVLMNSCAKDKVLESFINENCPDTVSFTNTIEPLINQNCATSGCHDNSAAGGYNLLGHSNVSGSANVALSAMRHDNGFEPMPFGGNQLPDTLIQKFDCWIAQGKQNN